MKLIKFFTGFLLFFITLVFVGELYVWNLESFETEFKVVTFYLQENTTKSEMMLDISKAAKKEKVEVFVVNKEVTSLFSEDINIYGTSGDIEKHLAQKAEVKAGNYESIFLGTVTVEFNEWEKIPDIDKVVNYYVIGNDENIINFKKSLVDKYAGRFPKDGYQTIDSKLSIGLVWMCVTLFLLLLTLYEVANLKKSIILRITIGEKIVFYLLRQIICDIVVYLTIFTGLIFTLSNYTNTFFQKKSTFLFFGIFLILNSLAYLWLIFTDYKKDMQTQKSAKTVLKISYFYKILTSIIIIITMTGCIELIVEGFNCYRQKNFFEDRKSYAYITVGGKTVEDAQRMSGIYYSQGRNAQKEISLVDLEKWETEAEYILADQGTINYLSTCIPELVDKKLKNKIYYLVPNQYLEKENIQEEMQNICYAYYGTEYEFEIIGYEKTAWVMAISNTGKVKSTLKKDPVVIFNNLNSMEIPSGNILYIGNATMFSFTDQEFEGIAAESNFKELHYKTNAYENYMYFWNVTKRNMIMGIVFLFILLVLEGLILRSILKCEYQINAKELLLGKIQGDNFLYRHRKVILILSGGWLSLLISIILCLVFHLSAVLYIIAGGILVMFMEYLFVAVYSHKLDHVNISKIFKGGML